MVTTIRELALGERSGEFRVLFLPGVYVLWRPPAKWVSLFPLYSYMVPSVRTGMLTD